MKIKITFLFFFLFFANILLAQNFVLGVTVNYAESKITPFARNQENFYKNFTPSFNAGLFLESIINNSMSWGIEAHLVQIKNVDEYEFFPYLTSTTPLQNEIIFTQGTHTQLIYTSRKKKNP